MFNQLSNILRDKSLSEILRGSSWALGLKVSAMVCGYLSTLIISNYFGPRTVGLFSLSFTVISVITLFSLMGFPTAILRFTSEYKDDYAQHAILKKMVVLSFTISITIISVVFLYADFISVNLFHDKGMKVFLYIMLIGAPFSISASVMIEYIRGLRQIRVSETLRNSMNMINFVIVLILVFIVKYDNLTPAVANVGAVSLVFLAALFYVLNVMKKQSFKNRTDVSYRQILAISLPMLMTASMFLVMSLSDRLMIGLFKTPYEVGIYAIAIKMSMITSITLVAINSILAPKYAELFWSHKHEELRKIIRFSSKIIFFSSAPVLICFFFFAEQIMSLFGKEFVQGATALVILSAGQFISSASGSVGYLMDMTGHHIAFRNIVVIASIVNLVLNYLLIPKYGYNGAAIATAFSMSLWNLLAVLFVKIKLKIFTGYVPLLR